MNIVPTQTASSSYDIDDTVEISAGQYWKHENGNVHLISSLNIIDNELHSIEVSPHPRYGGGGRFMSDEFFSKFVPITHEEAESIRSVEIKEVESEMNQIKLEMDAGYHDEDGISAKLLMERVSSSGMAQISMSPDAAHKQIEVIGEKSKVLQEIAQKQAEFIQEKSKAIATKTSLIASFYTEKGKQALASVDHTMKCVKKLQKSVYTLEVFTGKGVDVIKIRDGEPASQEEPLTFYQRKLFLDEEWFINLNAGGLDFRDMTDFTKALQEDISIIDRMAPSPRSVVLLQFRRSDKSYFPKDYEKSIGDIFYEAGMNEANRVRILLIRNGGMVHIVKTEDIADGVRLFPTAVEIDDNYRVSKQKRLFSGMTIDANDQKLNPKDLGYVEARNSHEEKTVYYQRVILILCGVHLRDNDVFGDFKNSNQFDNWFNEEFQNECCHFVHDDEDSLSDGITPVRDWIVEKNSIIQPGTRIVCSWWKIMDETTAPSAVKVVSGQRYDRTEWNYKPLRDIDVAIVKSSMGELYVEAECYNVNTKSKKNIKVYFERNSRLTNILALDTAKSSDIHYYLESRRHREHYLEYVNIFMYAQKVLKDEEISNKPFVDAMIDGACKALPQCSSDEIVSAVNDSVRIWRAENNGKLLPVTADKDYQKVLNAIGKQVWAMLSGDAVQLIDHYCQEGNISPTCVLMNGSGEYEVIIPDEHLVCSDGSLPFANSVTLKHGKNGFVLKSTERTLNRIRTASRMVKLYNDPKSAFAQLSHPSLPDYVEHLKEIIRLSADRLVTWHNGGTLNHLEVEFFMDLYVDAKNRWGEEVFMPFALVAQNDNLKIYGFSAYAKDLLAFYASDEQFEVVERRMAHWRGGRDKAKDLRKKRDIGNSPFEFRAYTKDVKKACFKPKHHSGAIRMLDADRLGSSHIWGQDSQKEMFSDNDSFLELIESKYIKSTLKSWNIVTPDERLNAFFAWYDPQRKSEYWKCSTTYSVSAGDASATLTVGKIIVTQEDLEHANAEHIFRYLRKTKLAEEVIVSIDGESFIFSDAKGGKAQCIIPISNVSAYSRQDESGDLILKAIIDAIKSGVECRGKGDGFGFNATREGELGRVHKRRPNVKVEKQVEEEDEDEI